MIFEEEYFSHYIYLPYFIFWLPLLLEILGNMCIVIFSFPCCDVTDFEISLGFLTKAVSNISHSPTLIHSELQKELFFRSLLKKFAKLQRKKPWWRFFGKVVSLQHPNLVKWNPTISIFLGITEIIFWFIFQNSYYMTEILFHNW